MAEAARRFSEVLDAIEHRGEAFLVSRKGRAIARIAPAGGSTGRVVKDILRDHPRDELWSRQLQELRATLALEERWND